MAAAGQQKPGLLVRPMGGGGGDGFALVGHTLTNVGCLHLDLHGVLTQYLCIIYLPPASLSPPPLSLSITHSLHVWV